MRAFGAWAIRLDNINTIQPQSLNGFTWDHNWVCTWLCVAHLIPLLYLKDTALHTLTSSLLHNASRCRPTGMHMFVTHIVLFIYRKCSKSIAYSIRLIISQPPRYFCSQVFLARVLSGVFWVSSRIFRGGGGEKNTKIK